MVRDKKGEGHAVLTVKTDRGEFILDNQEIRSALEQDGLPLRQAAVANRSEHLGRARRTAGTGGIGRYRDANATDRAAPNV